MSPELQVFNANSNSAGTIAIDQNGTATISDPAILEATDFSMLSLFQTDDPENVLWSLADRGLYVWTSEDPKSRAVNSFVVPTKAKIKKTDGTELTYPMKPFKITLLDKLKDGESVRWKVEVADGAKIGRLSIESPVVLEYPAADQAAGYTWQSVSNTDPAGKSLRFKPIMPPHTPATYEQGSGSLGMNTTGKNPKLSYLVTAEILNVKGVAKPNPYTAKIEMDEVDMIRQEYINHIQSAPESAVVGGRGVQRIVTVPTRSVLKAVADMPAGDWVDIADGYQYHYLLSDGMEQMWTDFQTAWNATSKTLTIPIDPYSITMPADDGIRVSSAYRNPERQEYYSTATKSLHMMGRALDIAATGVPSLGTSANPTPSKARGVVFNIVTNAIENNTIAAPYWDMWQLEDIDIKVVRNSGGFLDDQADGLDNDSSGILDGYERTGHLHLQDDPTKGNHR